MSFSSSWVFKNYCRGFACLCLLFSFQASAFSLIPDELNIPDKIKKRSAEQIKTIFSSLEKQYNQKTANLWKLKYKKALLLKKKDRDSFCLLMKELSEAPAFPLKDLARIQSYEQCPFSEEPPFDPYLFPEWLRLRLAEVFYNRRKFFDKPPTTLQALAYMAYNSPYKDLRISYLKQALFLAKELQKEEKISELTKRLYKEAPGLNPKPRSKDYFLVAEYFRKNRDFKKASTYYVHTLNSPVSSFKEKDLSFKGLDRIYKIQKDRSKQILNSSQWSQWLLNTNTPKSLRKYYNRRLELARQKWNYNENQKAIELVTEILKDPKSESIREEALYLRGHIYLQEKREDLSLKDWSEAIKRLYKKRRKPELLSKLLWKKVWLLREQKKYRESLRSLNLMEKVNKNPYTAYKLLFWKGKALQDLGHTFLANRSFNKLIEKDHFGYYGLLARKILDKKPSFNEREESQEQILSLVDKKSSDLIHWLVLFQESELLSQFLDYQKEGFVNLKNQSLEDWLKIIWLWTKAKRYLDVFRSLEQMNPPIKKVFLEKYIHFLFPLDFSKEVEMAARKHKVPPALIFAIIRQESAFNIRARSHADAFGLMQLIPSTARYTAQKFKIRYRNFRDLYHPPTNIALGTAHLKSLLNQYSHSFLYSVAAYNAGSTPLRRWLKDIPEKEVLSFIERIPYEETRTYVRLIIRNYIFYHNELEKKEPWFPKWPLLTPPES